MFYLNEWFFPTVSGTEVDQNLHIYCSLWTWTVPSTVRALHWTWERFGLDSSSNGLFEHPFVAQFVATTRDYCNLVFVLVDSELLQTSYFADIVHSAHIGFPEQTDCPVTYWKLFGKVRHTSFIALLLSSNTDPEHFVG